MNHIPQKRVLTFRNLLIGLIVLLLVSAGAYLALKNPSRPGLPEGETQKSQVFTPIPTAIQTLPAQPTINPSPFSLPTLPADIAPGEGLRRQGVFILSMADGLYRHLFAYHPQYLPLTRLTNSPADDIDPAVSPDGTQIAFSSRRNGYWDIYLLDLKTGQVNPFTDTQMYEGSPTWSPDGQWIAYEVYNGTNMDILIRSVANPAQEPIILTDDPACDHSPAWSPQGREIAFVSNRAGNDDIWVARLDQTEDRYHKASANSDQRENHPSWSPDGNSLAWSSGLDEGQTLMVWNPQDPGRYPAPVALGSWPVWDPSGAVLGAVVEGPNSTSLKALQLSNREMVFPLANMPGNLFGLQWRSGAVVDLLDHFPLPEGASDPIPDLWSPVISVNPPPPNNRFGVVDLQNVTAPFPYLHDQVDESFNSLRQEIARLAGWDFLSSLQNAYLPLTAPPDPGKVNNWLYTGRAIAVNSTAISASWMVVVKEQFDGQTYFHLYIRARYQDGSAGEPLVEQPWDINARYAGNPQTYDMGGRLGPVPPGYWVDFTETARRFQWTRVPALTNWRSYFEGARLNIYVLTNGLDWQSAMAEIYPPEALITPTYAPTRTPTVTLTPENFDRITTTPTAEPTATPTPRPTWTPGS